MTANSISLQNCAIHRVRFELWIFCKISSQCHNYIFCLNKYRNTQIINDNISENNFTSKKQRSEHLRPKERIKILFWNLSVSQFSRLGSSPFVLQISSNLCQEHFLWSDLCATTPICSMYLSSFTRLSLFTSLANDLLLSTAANSEILIT